jgi:hypothetical protein
MPSMQLGKINAPISGFEADRQRLIFAIQSQWWELPFHWDFGRDPKAIDPVEQLLSMIEKYLNFTVDKVEIQGDRVSVWLKGKQIDVTTIRP